MRIIIEIEVERVEGKFVSREEIEEYITDEVSNIGSFTVGDYDSEYEVVGADTMDPALIDKALKMYRKQAR